MFEEARGINPVGIALVSVGVLGATVLAYIVKTVLDQILESCRWPN